MRKLVVATTLVMMVAGSAVAQTGSSSSSSKQGVWPAPTGHRQPRADQVPQENSTSADAAMKREDAALDRKLKSICRGC